MIALRVIRLGGVSYRQYRPQPLVKCLKKFSSFLSYAISRSAHCSVARPRQKVSRISKMGAKVVDPRDSNAVAKPNRNYLIPHDLIGQCAGSAQATVHFYNSRMMPALHF